MCVCVYVCVCVFFSDALFINSLLSGALQLVVMPWAMVRVDPFVLLRSLPVIAGSGFFVTFVSPGFRTAAAAFVVAKVLDYSIRCEAFG